MSTIRNCTPHDIVIVDKVCTKLDPRSRKYILVGEIKVINVYPEDKEIPIPRVDTEDVDLGLNDDGTPIVGTRYLKSTNLPPREENVRYVVSAPTLLAAKALGRDDFLVPTRVVYDMSGPRPVVVGCLSLGPALD